MILICFSSLWPLYHIEPRKLQKLKVFGPFKDWMVFQRLCEEAECVPVRHWPGFEGLVDLHALIWNKERSLAHLELGDLHFLE